MTAVIYRVAGFSDLFVLAEDGRQAVDIACAVWRSHAQAVRPHLETNVVEAAAALFTHEVASRVWEIREDGIGVSGQTVGEHMKGDR